MAMSASTLATQLQSLSAQSSEPPAISALVAAWKTYFQDSAASVPYAANPAHDSAMSSALVGMKAPGAGLAKLQAGIVAWWGAVITTCATTYSGSIAATPPPGISALAATLTPIVTANVTGLQAGTLTKVQACQNLATAIHTANLGGTATFPPAVVTPII